MPKNGRPPVSCSECRRSKLKCSKSWPCTECQRRGCAHLCPTGVNTQRRTISTVLSENARLRDRLARSSPITVSESHIAASGPAPADEMVESAPLNLSPSIQLYHTAPPPSFSTPIPPVGQLSIGSGGGSKFYGPTAAAHVLPDEWADRDIRNNQSCSRIDSNVPLTFPLLRPSQSARQAFLDDARNQLPADDLLQKWTDSFWVASSWRFEPITKQYFDNLFLDPLNGTRATSRTGAQLGLRFSILAIGSLFDPDLPPHSTQAQTFDDFAMACLTAADFLTNTTVASLVCLHLHCCFLLNDSRPRTEEIYVVVGLALRLATSAGFHRDGTWWGLPELEVDARRRIWWEILTLERVNSNRFGCPSFINFGQFDALRPNDQSHDSFLFWRWEYDNVLHVLINRIEAIRTSPDLDGLSDADYAVKSYWQSVPNLLKPSQPLLNQGHDGFVLALQQRRLALHYYTGLHQLHRLGMNRALRLHASEPLDSQFASSVNIMINEACRNVIDLVDDIYSLSPINTRHMVVALDLFSVLVPQAALVIRSPRSSLAVTCHHQLVRGVDLLEKAARQTPCPWYLALLQRGQKLAAKATTSLQTRFNTTQRPSENQETDGVDELLGDITQLHKYQQSAAPSPAPESRNIAMTIADDVEFERWISSLIEDSPLDLLTGSGSNPGYQQGDTRLNDSNFDFTQFQLP
ncbi:uncharacterized protein IL334_005168 [Kwoniella shivajii]|uniref:Zn(2)-C6 fungal-type domain-containing protein n=1 Tax=Kwoniella shivajii TaxID=564305 RepID=A0ABZ1D2L2_9TREE|nr:hypothetical protein IL334_005168 [Kwoniella shivajii]